MTFTKPSCTLKVQLSAHCHWNVEPRSPIAWSFGVFQKASLTNTSRKEGTLRRRPASQWHLPTLSKSQALFPCLFLQSQQDCASRVVLKPRLLQDTLCLACHGSSLEHWRSNSSPANLLLTRTGQHTRSSKLKFPYLENTDPNPSVSQGLVGTKQKTGLDHLLCGNLNPHGLNIPKFSFTFSAHGLLTSLWSLSLLSSCFILCTTQITKSNENECVCLPHLECNSRDTGDSSFHAQSFYLQPLAIS